MPVYTCVHFCLKENETVARVRSKIEREKILMYLNIFINETRKAINIADF